MTPNRSVNVSAIVVGAGLMGSWHAAAIRRAGGRIMAVVDTDESRASALARRFGKAKSFTRLDDALGQIRPEIVHLCTPATAHKHQAEQALSAGAHVLVEKPLAPTLEDTQFIFDLAASRGLAVCPVHQFVFQDGIQRVQTWLPGAGNISQITFVIRSAGGVGYGEADLDTLIADILPHPLSLLQVLLPGSLESRWSISRPANGELRLLGTFTRNSLPGMGLAIEVSLNARPTQNTLVVAAENATLVADLFHGFAFRLPGTVSRTQKIIQPFELSLLQFSATAKNLVLRALTNESAYPGLRRLVSLFYRSVRLGGNPPIPVQDSLAVARARQVILSNIT